MHAEDDDVESDDFLPNDEDNECLENIQVSNELRAGVTRAEMLDILDLLTSKKKLIPDVPLYRRLVLGKHVHTEKRDCRFLAEMLQSAIFSYKLDAASQILEEIISRPYPADQLAYKTGMFLIEAHPFSTPEKMNYFIR
ncbi:uncharacterized protein LOC135376669 isoform X1 [Ornithodoros turicata]|uniref:uncharacterized protein LOC135376669 isoform X1 n=1 Tax=Ornithodoros turicata TaxID=34597 RepID=UPI003138F664